MTLKDVESVKIDGIDYPIKFIPAEVASDLEFVGKIDYANHTIKLVDHSEKYKTQTLMHELMHVIDENRLGSKLSEAEINTIGCGFAQIMLDNPDLVLAIYWAAVGDLIEIEPADEDEEGEDETDSETEC